MMANDVEVTQADRDAAEASVVPLLAVGHVNHDWQPYLNAMAKAFARHRINAQPKPTGDVGELVKRLRWLADEHFEMLGDIHEPLTEAADAITALHARVQELEAKWVELPGVE